MERVPQCISYFKHYASCRYQHLPIYDPQSLCICSSIRISRINRLRTVPTGTFQQRKRLVDAYHTGNEDIHTLTYTVQPEGPPTSKGEKPLPRVVFPPEHIQPSRAFRPPMGTKPSRHNSSPLHGAARSASGAHPKPCKKFNQIRSETTRRVKNGTSSTHTLSLGSKPSSVSEYSLTERSRRYFEKMMKTSLHSGHFPKTQQYQTDITLEEALETRWLVNQRIVPDYTKDGEGKGIFCGDVSYTKFHQSVEKEFRSYYQTGEISDEGYRKAETLHKEINAHHPDFLHRQQTAYETYETMMDLFSCSLRETGNPIKSFNQIWDWIFYYDTVEGIRTHQQVRVNEKYKNLNPVGVVMFTSQCHTRGFSSRHAETAKVFSRTFRKIAYQDMMTRWQAAGGAKQNFNAGIANMLSRIHNSLAEAHPLVRPLLSAYSNELALHSGMVNYELHRLGRPGAHDGDKKERDSFLNYAYHWGVQEGHGNNVYCPGSTVPSYIVNKLDVEEVEVMGMSFPTCSKDLIGPMKLINVETPRVQLVAEDLRVNHKKVMEQRIAVKTIKDIIQKRQSKVRSPRKQKKPQKFVPFAYKQHKDDAEQAWDMGAFAEALPEAEHTGLFDAMAASTTNMGSEIITQTLESPQVQDYISNLVDKKLDPKFDKVYKLAEELQQTTTDKLDKADATMDKVNSLLDKYDEQLQPLLAKADSATSSFQEIGQMVKGLVENVKNFIPEQKSGVSWTKFPSMWWESVNVTDVCYLITLYAFYCSTDSWIVKGAAVLAALRHLGVLEKLMSTIQTLWTYFKEWKEEPEHTAKESDIPEPESWLEMLGQLCVEMNWRKGAFLVGLLIVSLCGVTVSSPVLKELGKKMMGSLTTMHFVGLGLLGAKRIFEYTHSAFEVAIEYIKENILGMKSKHQEHGAEIAKWFVRLSLFKSEEGIAMMRTSQKAIEEAETIYPTAVKFMLELYKNKDWAGPDMRQLVYSNFKDALVVANIIHRIKAHTSFRPTMFHVQMVGRVGIGKSTLCNHIARTLKDELFVAAPHDNLVYAMGDTDHFDGYTGQLFIVADDIFKFNDPQHMSTLITLITNTPILLPMSHLEDKGVHLTSEVMLSTTNIPYPPVKDLYCHKALYRRRHALLDVKCDPSVINASTGKFDSELYEKVYGEKNKYYLTTEGRREFPHLKFDFLKPVPESSSPLEQHYKILDLCENYNPDTFTVTCIHENNRDKPVSVNVAEKLCTCGTCVICTEIKGMCESCLKVVGAGNKLYVQEGNIYYQQGDALPKGMSMPLSGLTYKQMINQVSSRYRAMRLEEQSLSPEQKTRFVNFSFSEIDNCIDALYDGDEDAIPEHMASWRLPCDVPIFLGVDREKAFAGRKAYTKTSDKLFEVMKIKLDKLAEELCKNPDGKVDKKVIDKNTEHTGRVGPRDDVQMEPGQASEWQYNQRFIEKPEELEANKMDHFGDPVDDYGLGRYDVLPENFDMESEMGRLDFERKRRTQVLRRKYKCTTTCAGDENYNRPVWCLKENVKYVNRYGTKCESLCMPLSTMYKNFDRLVDKENSIIFREHSTYTSDNVISCIIRNMFCMYGSDQTYEITNSRLVKPEGDMFSPQQKNISMPLAFLKNLIWHKDTWYFKIDQDNWSTYFHAKYGEKMQATWDAMSPNEKEAATTLGVTLNDPRKLLYTFQVDENNYANVFILPEHLLCLCPRFREASRDLLTRFTPSQAQEFIQQAEVLSMSWPEKVLKDSFLKGLIEPVKKAFSKFTDFYHWFWYKYVCGWRWIMTLLFAWIAIKVIQGIAGMLTPKEEHTSKVLFKGTGNRPTMAIHTSSNFEVLSDSLLEKNLTYCKTSAGSFNALRCDRYFYSCYHVVRRHVEAEENFIMQYTPTTYSDIVWEIPIKYTDVYHVPQSDFCVIYSPLLQQARNINDWFLKDADLERLRDNDVLHMYYDAPGKPKYVLKKPLEVKVNNEFGIDGKIYSYHKMVRLNAPSVRGSSGGAVLTSNPRIEGARRIIGLQSVNSERTAFVQVVTQEMLQLAFAQMKVSKPIILDMGPPIAEETIQPNATRYITDHCDVQGFIPKTHRAGAIGKTKFQRTIFAGKLIPEDQETHEPSILSLSDKRITYEQRCNNIHPLAKSFNKFGRDVMKPFPDEILDQAIIDISMYIKYKAMKGKTPREMSLEEIVLGHDHPGSGSMELSTSPGLPWVLDKYKGKPKGKKAYLEIVTHEDGSPNDFWIHPELLESYQNYEQCYASGIIPPSTMYEFPKDELRAKTKLLSTRSVSVMNLENVMLFRKTHLDLTAHMHQAAMRGDFQSCVGINPEGISWANLYHELVSKSPEHCFDLDVSNWDGHMTPQLFYAASDVVSRIYEDDESSENYMIRRSIVTAAVFGYDQFEDMSFKKLRGMPSGFAGTSIYNTIVHMMVFYCFWLLLCAQNNLPGYANFNMYLSCVAVFFYGDDVVCSVSPQVVDWFNSMTIAEMYSYYGWPTTSAAKDGKIAPFVSVNDVQFLKRKFRVETGKHSLGSFIVHSQISEQVINNLLLFIRVNSGTILLEQLYENINCAMQFAFAHGEDVYNDLFSRINTILAEEGEMPFLISYKTMRDCMLRERFGI